MLYVAVNVALRHICTVRNMILEEVSVVVQSDLERILWFLIYLGHKILRNIDVCAKIGSQQHWFKNADLIVESILIDFNRS
jgi:hypothetical protein